MVKIYDDEGLQSSELIGCAQVNLCDLQPGKVQDMWLKLVKDLEVQRDNKKRGEVIDYIESINYFSVKLCRLIVQCYNTRRLRTL